MSKTIYISWVIVLLIGCVSVAVKDYDISKLEKYKVEANINLSQECIDSSAMLLFGKFGFNFQDPFSGVSCASCHIVEKAGFSANVADHGGGLINATRIEVSEFLYGTNHPMPVDQKPIKTPKIVNSGNKKNMFWQGADLPFALEAQVDTASHAHFQEAIHLSLRFDQMAYDLSQRAFGKPYSFDLLKCAIAGYEASIVSDENDVNLAVRGDTKALGRINWEGEELYSSLCFDCHSNNKRIPSLALEPKFDTIAAPFLENFYDSPKPHFFSSKHSSFHNRELLSGHEIMTRHTDKGVVRQLTQKEKRDIIAFLKNLHDPNLKRYE